MKETEDQKKYREKGQMQGIMAMCFTGLLLYSFFKDELSALLLCYAGLVLVAAWTVDKIIEERKEKKDIKEEIGQ